MYSLINDFIVENEVGGEEIKLMAVRDRLRHTVDSLRFEHIVFVRFHCFCVKFGNPTKKLFLKNQFVNF